MSTYFITGIDTDVGKSFATGLAARFLMRRGVPVITQKIVQTGASGAISEDIVLHRRIMEIEPLADDRDGTTCSHVFRFPASPHLAAERENRKIDPAKITWDTDRLLKKYDTVLIEGAGGLHVPLRRDFLTVDYLREQKHPLMIVTSGRLGSVNHTLLTLEAAANRRIPIAGIVFNRYPPSDAAISSDAMGIFYERLGKYGRANAMVEMPEIDLQNIPDVDFSPIFDT